MVTKIHIWDQDVSPPALGLTNLLKWRDRKDSGVSEWMVCSYHSNPKPFFLSWCSMYFATISQHKTMHLKYRWNGLGFTVDMGVVATALTIACWSSSKNPQEDKKIHRVKWCQTLTLSFTSSVCLNNIGASLVSWKHFATSIFCQIILHYDYNDMPILTIIAARKLFSFYI